VVDAQRKPTQGGCREGGTFGLRAAAGALDVERRKRTDLGLARRNRRGAQVDDLGRGQFAGIDAAGEIERREHHSGLSISVTNACVRRRPHGVARKAGTAATGQPTMNADIQRPTKSTRNPILVQVTTPLTTNTMMAVIRTGKMNLALPSIP